MVAFYVLHRRPLPTDSLAADPANHTALFGAAQKFLRPVDQAAIDQFQPLAGFASRIFDSFGGFRHDRFLKNFEQKREPANIPISRRVPSDALMCTLNGCANNKAQFCLCDPVCTLTIKLTQTSCHSNTFGTVGLWASPPTALDQAGGREAMWLLRFGVSIAITHGLLPFLASVQHAFCR